LGGTAAAPRHLPPYAPPMSALSADEPAAAHATREPIEQPWSSPFPPSLAFMEEPWRATRLLRLLIPGLAMPANVSAQAQFGFPTYARRATSHYRRGSTYVQQVANFPGEADHDAQLLTRNWVPVGRAVADPGW